MTASRRFLYEEINGPQYSGEASLSKPSHSANPREECRFILLGGDDIAKNEACKILLRNGQSKQRADLEGWEVKENHVQGRHVTVAISPSPWLKHLKSFFFSRRVKSIKNDLQKCASLVFPGPNAFLLVIRDGQDPGKVHLLLKAVASVFGKEAFDYSMVLFIRGDGEKTSEPASMKCVLKCGKRRHFLEDTDSSVQNLFRKVENMIANTNSKFFIPPAYAELMNKFEPWEKKRILYIKTLLDECKDEKRQKDQHINEQKMKMETLQQREYELRKELDTSKSNELILRKELDTSQLREGQLRKELDAATQRESKLGKQLDDYEMKNTKLRKQLDDFKLKEHTLRNDSDVLQIKNSELEKKLGDTRLRERELEKKLDDTRLRESELEKKLDGSWLRERELEKKLDDTRLRESELEKKLGDTRLRESELEKKLDDTRLRESELEKKLGDSRLREGELEKKLDDTRLRERELEKKLDDTWLRERELEKWLDDTRLRERELEKRLGDTRLRESELGKKLDHSQLRESELEKDLEATQLRENNLRKELDDFKRNKYNPGSVLDPSQQRESEVRKEDHGVERDNSKEQAPQPIGTRERRGSKDTELPHFSTDQSQYEQTIQANQNKDTTRTESGAK